jgi:hypothetical protein
MKRSFKVLVAALSVCGCEAGRTPSAPSAVAESAEPRIEAENLVQVAIDRGTFEITSRPSTDLAIFANDHSKKLAWTGTVSEGNNPLEAQSPAPAGTTVSLGTTWSGISLATTTLTWAGVTYTNIGGAQANTGGVFELHGNFVMPPYKGQATTHVTTPFTVGDTMFFVYDPQPEGALQLYLTGGGTATVWLTWVPTPAPPSLPQGYWWMTRVLYKFKHQ